MCWSHIGQCVWKLTQRLLGEKGPVFFYATPRLLCPTIAEHCHWLKRGVLSRGRGSSVETHALAGVRTSVFTATKSTTRNGFAL
jgi:hypothetical protein